MGSSKQMTEELKMNLIDAYDTWKGYKNACSMYIK